MSGRRDSYASHAVALFDSGDDLRRRVLPFVRDGLAACEAVIAVVSEDTAAHLRDGLGVDHRDVRWQLPELSYHSLGPMFDSLRRYLAEQHDAGYRVRLIAENDTPSSPARTAAYLRFEAASNQVLGAFGFPWLCLYDRRRYPAGLLERVGQVHPLLVGPDGQPRASYAFVPPDAYLRAHPGPLSPVPAQPPIDIWVAAVGQFSAVRRTAADAASGFGLSEEAGDDFELATAEVLSNALRHGDRPCRVRVWATQLHVVLRVDDQGPGDDITTKGFHPPDPAHGQFGGMGLWMIRQLADVVHVETDNAGTAVEVQFPRSPVHQPLTGEREMPHR